MDGESASVERSRKARENCQGRVLCRYESGLDYAAELHAVYSSPRA